jgi:HlyD family secretion protein
MHIARRTAFVLLAAALIAGCGNGNRGDNPSGTLESTEVDLASLIPARILQVRPQLGDHVKRGDTVIVLDTELLQRQRAQNAASRESNAAQQKVAEDALRQARANLDLAETSLQRTKGLFAQGSATQQQLDEAQTKRDVAADGVQAARHQIDLLQSQLVGLDDLLKVNDQQISEGIITSPLNGTVILRNAEPGEVASVGAVQLRVSDLDTLELRVYLGEQDLAKVKIGQQFPVLVDALKGQQLTGTVTWISSEAEFTPKNAQTRQARTQLVYAIKLAVPNPTGNLHIGMPAEVKL